MEKTVTANEVNKWLKDGIEDTNPDLKTKLSEFLEEQETFWMDSDDLAEVILKFLDEEYERQLNKISSKL
jgi:hypothetical protein